MTTVRVLVVRGLLRDHPVLTALSVIGAIAATGGRLAVPVALARAVDSMSGRGPAARLLLLAGVLLLVSLLGSVLAGQATAYRTADMTARYRMRLLERSLRLPVTQQAFSPGELITRFSTDTAAPAQVASSSVSVGLTITGGLVALAAIWLIDWRIGTLMLVELATSWLVVRIFLRQSGDAEARYRTARGKLAALLVDAYNGIRTIRVSGTSERERERILAPLAELRVAGLASWRSQRDVTWRVSLLDIVREVALLVTAGLGVVSGRLTAGELLAVLVYSQLALEAVGQVDALLGIVRSATSCRRLLDVLNAPVTPVPRAPRQLPPTGSGEIRFERVTVANDSGPVFTDVTFTISAGLHIAVVGHSGAGKSMLVALIGRLVDADAGRVLLDGVDVSDIEPDVLRRAVAYAFEEPRLFGATVADAIAAGTPISRSDVVHAATLARSDAFIERLPDGYATALDAAPFSGGELQRVGLARAFARHARVLVLDDATSSLDTATAAEVSQAIRTSWGARTALIVAHRTATAASADLVAWLDDGRLRALAPHRDLWQDPRYRAVFGGALESALVAGQETR